MNKYDYTNSYYKNLSEKIDITCPIHGIFSQRAINHLYGKGCSKCGFISKGLKNSKHLSKDLDYFLKKARQKHGNLYNYDKVQFTRTKDPVIIQCRSHGDFLQIAWDHIYHGCGCPRCAQCGRSRGQDSWLDSLDIPNNQECRNVRIYLKNGKWLRADGFLNNTFYEFWGDWAHGNPMYYDPNDYNQKYKKTYGELYNNTLIKRQLIFENGFDLIEIWESEWKSKLY